MSKKDKSNRAKLIINPGAGDGTEETTKMKFAIDYLKKKGLKVDVALAKPKTEATTTARRAGKKGYKVVIAMGGDGTIEAVMRGIIGTKVCLGVIPMGTANNIAKSLGIPQDLEKACDLIIADTSRKLDVGQIKTSKGKKFYFIEMATIGLAAAIYPDANKIAGGKLSSIKDTALTFFHHDTHPDVFLTINNESKVKVNTMLVMASNTPINGKNFLFAPEASMQDGLLDITIYPDFNKAELIRYFAEVMNEGYSGDKKVQYYQARKLKVKTDPKLDVMADGIMLGKGKVKIKVLPRALRVITNSSDPGIAGIQKAADEESAKPGDKAAKQTLPVEAAIKVG